jgi:uncharacterized protein (TIGR00369 family)
VGKDTIAVREPQETTWEARNPDFEDVVRSAFQQQSAMALIGAVLEEVEPGVVTIGLKVHHGIMSHVPPIVHGGTIGMIADSAMGFAALTLAPPGGSGVTVEYKLNLLSPAIGEKLVARGVVLKPGSKITVAEADIFVIKDGVRKLVAKSQGTLISS